MTDQQEHEVVQKEIASCSSQQQNEAPEAGNETSTTAPDASSSSSSTATVSPQRQCGNCCFLETEQKALKPCTKCQSILYCSRECQKAGWKVHKKTCAKDAQAYALKANLKASRLYLDYATRIQESLSSLISFPCSSRYSEILGSN
jgi:hypothetical protein